MPIGHVGVGACAKQLLDARERAALPDERDPSTGLGCYLQVTWLGSGLGSGLGLGLGLGLG